MTARYKLRLDVGVANTSETPRTLALSISQNVLRSGAPAYLTAIPITAMRMSSGAAGVGCDTAFTAMLRLPRDGGGAGEGSGGGGSIGGDGNSGDRGGGGAGKGGSSGGRAIVYSRVSLRMILR